LVLQSVFARLSPTVTSLSVSLCVFRAPLYRIAQTFLALAEAKCIAQFRFHFLELDLGCGAVALPASAMGSPRRADKVRVGR
jgi:hypothetical protein